MPKLTNPGGGASIDLTAPGPIGGTTPAAGTFTSLITSGQSLTGSQAASLVNLATTWNTTGTPSMIYGRVTNTASNAASLLIDVGTVAGGSLFKVAASNGNATATRWAVTSSSSYLDANCNVAGTHIVESGLIMLNSGQTVGVRRGTGTPEGVVTAGIGSLFLRTDGGTSTTLYVKESGTGNTGWVAK